MAKQEPLLIVIEAIKHLIVMQKPAYGDVKGILDQLEEAKAQVRQNPDGQKENQ